MFKQLKNIDTAFKHIRTFSIVVIVAYTLLCVFVVYKSNQAVTESRQHVLVIANGKALEAFSSDRKVNIPVEARDHIRMFHFYFFTLDPDDKVIQANITRALYLADNSADKIYKDLKEQGYYSDLISANISQQVTIDSVDVDIDQYPYHFRCFAKEKLTRPTSVVTRSLITEGYLRNVARSDNNPHGFLIERWSILENKDLKIENR